MDALPARPRLRPGLGVARHDDLHLRLGVDPPLRRLLPDTPEVRRLLDALLTGRPPGRLSETADRLLHELVADGLVVDGAALLEAARSASPRPGATRGAVAQAFAEHGLEAPERLAARGAVRVGVRGADETRRSLEALLVADGVGTGPGADVHVVVTTGEPDRDDLDGLVRDGVPHLLVAVLPDGLRVGPFVQPGVTACLRCVDAHLAERDPRRGMVIAQLHDDPPPSPWPVDPALLALALAWAARDVVTWCDGGRPATWSASALVTPALDLTPHRWTRHPACGCSWGDLVTAS